MGMQRDRPCEMCPAANESCPAEFSKQFVDRRGLGISAPDSAVENRNRHRKILNPRHVEGSAREGRDRDAVDRNPEGASGRRDRAANARLRLATRCRWDEERHLGRPLGSVGQPPHRSRRSTRDEERRMCPVHDRNDRQQVLIARVELAPPPRRNIDATADPHHQPPATGALEFPWITARSPDVFDEDEFSTQVPDVRHVEMMRLPSTPHPRARRGRWPAGARLCGAGPASAPLRSRPPLAEQGRSSRSGSNGRGNYRARTTRPSSQTGSSDSYTRPSEPKTTNRSNERANQRS